MKFEDRFREISNELGADVKEVDGELKMVFQNSNDYLDEWRLWMGKIVRLDSGFLFPEYTCSEDDNIVEDVFKFGILAHIHKDENYDKVVNKISESGIPTIIVHWETGEKLDELNIE